jgi:hypothetical protein
MRLRTQYTVRPYETSHTIHHIWSFLSHIIHSIPHFGGTSQWLSYWQCSSSIKCNISLIRQNRCCSLFSPIVSSDKQLVFPHFRDQLRLLKADEWLERSEARQVWHYGGSIPYTIYLSVLTTLVTGVTGRAVTRRLLAFPYTITSIILLFPTVADQLCLVKREKSFQHSEGRQAWHYWGSTAYMPTAIILHLCYVSSVVTALQCFGHCKVML